MHKPFIPSRDWQDVPDWAAIPPGCEHRLNPNTKTPQARWDNPPGPEKVVDISQFLSNNDQTEAATAAASPLKTADQLREEARAARLETQRQASEIPPIETTEAITYEDVDLDNLPDEDQELVPEFPLETLPDTFREPVEEVMRHYRVPALLPAVCALGVNSVALGRGIVIKSNVRRTYGNLYLIIGALSGTGKSPVYDEFTAPLMMLQKESLANFKANQKPQAEADLKILEREIQSLLKQGKDPGKFDPAEDARRERLAELLQQKAELEDRMRYSSRLWTEDFTSEALGVLLANNHEQMAILTDDGGLVVYNLLGRYNDGDVKDDVLLCKAKTVSPVPIDRVGRESVLLHQPCVAMLVLTQPDLLHKLFANGRLLVGGFLARCLAVDSKMQIQDETEESEPECDHVIMTKWSAHIESLVKTFRFAEEPYWINAEPAVRKLSRNYFNMWAAKGRGTLSDISSFAVRWCERAWEIAINLHMGIHGANWLDCPSELSTETFQNAIRISDFFAERQFEVLQRPRIEAQKKSRSRLQEVLELNQRKPMTLRVLRDRHGIPKEEVVSTVKSHPDTFGITIVDPPHGGSKSTLVFLRSNPPPGVRSKK